jgi:glycosyltransferase involved in cell wall biosynthesis
MIRKTILYITPALPVGGAEMFLASICNGLVEDGIRQVLVCLSENAPLKSAFDESIRTHILHRRSKFDIRPARELRRIIQQEHPDHIFCLNFFSFFFTRLAAMGADKDIPYIISYHSTKHVNRKDHFMHRIFPKLMRPQDRVIMVSTNQSRHTISEYGIPAAQALVIHNGIDPERWTLMPASFDRKAFRQGLGISDDAPVIVMTAAFREEKNHGDAIRALELLHGQYGLHAYFLLVGSGPLMEEIREQVSASNVSGFVKFTGSQKDVRPYLWASDLFTLTSFSETFSMAALEAMSCGLPSVLTSIGGASEMILSGVNGMICESNAEDIAEKWNATLRKHHSGEAIHDLINDRFTREKMMTAYRKEMGLNP